jgi:hypothetical protein
MIMHYSFGVVQVAVHVRFPTFALYGGSFPIHGDDFKKVKNSY